MECPLRSWRRKPGTSGSAPEQPSSLACWMENERSPQSLRRRASHCRGVSPSRACPPCSITWLKCDSSCRLRMVLTRSLRSKWSRGRAPLPSWCRCSRLRSSIGWHGRSPLRRGSTSALPGLAVCALQLGVILAGAAVAWIVLSHTTTLFTPLALISAMPIFWAFTFVHELAHAIACIQYGIRPRSMGVALWYYFIPIAYVDRTDAYRLRSRSERVAISLAGPAADMALATLLGSLLILDVIGPNEFWGQVAVALVFFLLVSLFGNLNPLLPTDGQQAVESATGLVNVRNRSILYLTGLLRLSEGTPRPPRTRQERWAMITYGVVCLLYIVAVAGLMIFSIGRLIWGLWVMFS